ncbi:hypothetical protein [Chitinophaga sp. MM2321]|uniref:hypothetical protein n=1 Tax=Chitinophaga sp. MM2321 TaxID=3137178 RepID=UPI0032D59A3A
MSANERKTDATKAIGLRQNLHLLLLENPNYFGIQDSNSIFNEKFKPVLSILSDTFFEQLTCVSYKPDIQRLSAIVKIKQASGYSGGPCTKGSKEYVRFYASYDNGASWEDEGITDFDAHDLGYTDDFCYELAIPFVSKRKSCCDRTPVLPLIRAILSWNKIPPAGVPNWLPNWGNVLEARVQAPSRTGFICYLTGVFGQIDVKLNEKQYELLDQALITHEYTPVISNNPTLIDIKRQYGKEVEDARIGYSFANDTLKNQELLSADQYEVFKKYNLDLKSILDFIKLKKFNTTYEEVHCVGLNRNFDTLNAAIEVKKNVGYSGNLCSKGSREYLAYYMDFGAGWVFMGTTYVTVHDIPIPQGGLWYNAPLHISLDKYQKAWCITGKAKLRVVLSWNLVPPVDPNWVAPWGDWEECNVEIKPLPSGVDPGNFKPFIELVGGMPVSDINPINKNAYGLHTLGFVANNSPFAGNTTFRGLFFNQSTHSYKYKILITAPGGSEHPVMDKVNLHTDTFGIISPLITLIPDAAGWINYLANPATNTVIVDNYFGAYTPAVDGVHSVRLEVWDLNTGIIYYSNAVDFNANVAGPVVAIAITSGAGNCGKFLPGDVMEGTYSITDSDCGGMTIYVTPGIPGAVFDIDGVPGVSALSYTGGTLPSSGQSGTWKLHMPATTVSCGYNIWIQGNDRSIVGSSQLGHYSYGLQGFCVLDKK